MWKKLAGLSYCPFCLVVSYSVRASRAGGTSLGFPVCSARLLSRGWAQEGEG